MQTCENCKWEYPDGYVASMQIYTPEKGSHVAKLCGICALHIMNKIHGTNFKRFKGEAAETMRKRALTWRHDHPKGKDDSP